MYTHRETGGRPGETRGDQGRPGETAWPSLAQLVFHLFSFASFLKRRHQGLLVSTRGRLGETVRVGTIRVGIIRVGIIRVGTVRVGTVRVGTVRVGTVRVGTVRVGIVRVGTVSVGTIRVDYLGAMSPKTILIFNSNFG